MSHGLTHRPTWGCDRAWLVESLPSARIDCDSLGTGVCMWLLGAAPIHTLFGVEGREGAVALVGQDSGGIMVRLERTAVRPLVYSLDNTDVVLNSSPAVIDSVWHAVQHTETSRQEVSRTSTFSQPVRPVGLTRPTDYRPLDVLRPLSTCPYIPTCVPCTLTIITTRSCQGLITSFQTRRAYLGSEAWTGTDIRIRPFTYARQQQMTAGGPKFDRQ
jgi:hypothetical protein